MKSSLLEQQQVYQHCRKMYGRYFLWALIHFEIAGIISTHFIYISELNDCECNDGTTIMILVLLMHVLLRVIIQRHINSIQILLKYYLKSFVLYVPTKYLRKAGRQEGRKERRQLASSHLRLSSLPLLLYKESGQA